MPRNSVPPDGLDDSVIPELAPIAGSTDGRLEKHLASPPFVSTTDNDITAGSRVQTRNSHIARDEKKNPQRLASIESCCAVDSGTLAKLGFTSATGARSRLLRLRETRFNWPSDPQLSNLGLKESLQVLALHPSDPLCQLVYAELRFLCPPVYSSACHSKAVGCFLYRQPFFVRFHASTSYAARLWARACVDADELAYGSPGTLYYTV